MGGQSAAAGRTLPALLVLAAALVLGVLSSHVSAATCTDKKVPGRFTCVQQARYGKCGASFMKGFCNKTCGRCRSPGQAPAPCVDVKVPGRFTCAQQRAFGKCGQPFMRGYCARTCGRCKGPTPKPRPTPKRKPTKRKPAPKPKPGPNAKILQVQRDSSIRDPSAISCRPDGDGGRLCGIPIGYKGAPGRNGYYYMPKVHKLSRTLKRLVIEFEAYR